VRVVFSGRTNQLKMVAGSTTYYGASRSALSLTTTTQFATAGETDQLAIDLEGKLKTLSTTTNTGSFTLTGTYQHINVAGFQNSLSAQGLTALAEGNTVSDLHFITFKDTQTKALRLKLVSFKVNGKVIK
jgi:hypothetical protein